MDSEIEEGGKAAIKLLQDAFYEIDREESTNSKKTKLTSIQRNRMAVNYLEMNDQPEKFDYFKRFIDTDKYAELGFRYLSGQVDEEKEMVKLKEIHAMMQKQKQHIRIERTERIQRKKD